MWLKKLYRRIFEAEFKLGELPRPPDNTENTLIPLKWRFDVAGQLDCEFDRIYSKLSFMTYKSENFLGFKNPRKTLHK